MKFKSLLCYALAAAVFAGGGSCSDDKNEPPAEPGTIDMTRMTADEVTTAIKEALAAGVTEFKLKGEFAKIGIPAQASLAGFSTGNPFFDSNVEMIDLTGVTDWPKVNVDGIRDENQNYLPGDVRGLPARAFDGLAAYDNGEPYYVYPALREVKLPAEVKALGIYAFISCEALTAVFCDGVEEVGRQAFSFCSALTTVELPETTRIYGFAFLDSGLTSLSLPKATFFGTGVFNQCYDLAELRLTAPGDLTLEKENGVIFIPPNIAEQCSLTLNTNKHYDTGTASPKAVSENQWATDYSESPLTWKSIAFE